MSNDSCLICNLPKEIFEIIHYYLCPEGDGSMDSGSFKKMFRLICLRATQKYNEIDLPEDEQQLDQYENLIRQWPQIIKNLSLSCRSLREAVEAQQRQSWRLSALHSIATMVRSRTFEKFSINPINIGDLSNPRRPDTKQYARYWEQNVRPAVPTIIRARLVRVHERELSPMTLRLLYCNNMDEALAMPDVDYFAVTKEVRQLHLALVRQLRNEAAFNAKMFRRLMPWELYIKRPLYIIGFSLAGLLSAVAFIGLTVYWALLTIFGLLHIVEGRLQILLHVMFGLLLLAAAILLVLSIAKAVTTCMSAFVNKKYPWSAVAAVLFGVWLVLQTGLVYANTVVPYGIPGMVVVVPSIVCILCTSCVFCVMMGLPIVRFSFRRKLFESISSTLVFGFTTVPLNISMFLLLICSLVTGLGLTFQFHVGYSFIPLYILELLFFLVILTELRLAKSISKGISSALFASGLVCVIATHVTQSIWNTYFLVAPLALTSISWTLALVLAQCREQERYKKAKEARRLLKEMTQIS